MPIQPLCAALALAALLLAAPPAPATSVGNVAPPSVGVAAQPDSGSDRTDILFQTGLAAIAASGRPGLPEDTRDALLNEAIANFRAILIDSPGLVRVRLELARTFFLKGEDVLARRHFEWVLAGTLPRLWSPTSTASLRLCAHASAGRRISGLPLRRTATSTRLRTAPSSTSIPHSAGCPSAVMLLRWHVRVWAWRSGAVGNTSIR